MSYTLNADGTVTLDTGERVSVSVTRVRLPNGAGVAFTASAAWVDDSGTPHEDGSGPVTSETTFNADSAALDANGEDALARALLLTVLGEDQSILAFSDDYKTNVSIRAHIAAANAPELDPSSLLA